MIRFAIGNFMHLIEVQHKLKKQSIAYDFHVKKDMMVMLLIVWRSWLCIPKELE